MSISLSTRTVCCKLAVDAAANAALRQTQMAFNAAASYCASVAWEQGVTNKNKLHYLVYAESRVTYGLGAQLACCARDKAAEAVRAVRAAPERHDKKTDQILPKTCPTFAADSSIRYDARTYRLMSMDRVSLKTLTGRVIGQLVLGEFQRRYLYDTSWKIGGAELIRRADVWYLCITQSKAAPTPDEPEGYLGVDLGITNLAADSDGETYSGAEVQRVRERRYRHRRRLQLANTRRARWRLRKIARREHRFQKDTNHRISKALIQKARTERKALALENLDGIRERVTVRRTQRRARHSWAFGQLRAFIGYKAQLSGVRVVFVDPRNTSRTCAVCGHCDKRNRPDQAHFRCLSCGHTAAADTNAAVNIARVAAVNQPIVSLLSHGIERADTSPGALETAEKVYGTISSSKEEAMLRASYAPMVSDQDQLIFETLVPPDHYLRQVRAVVDFERYRAIMATCYHATDGRPADDPVVLLKVGFLQTHYNLSDREVIAQAQVNVAFRYFLNLALTDVLAHPSLLTVFRARLGAELYQQIFDGVVGQARAAGLVKNRLRLKDATHIIANIAIPSTIRLIAQMRQRLLAAAEPFAAECVTAERAHALAIHTATADLSDEERLLARVTNLRQIVAWADQVSSDLGPLPQELSAACRAFADALALAHKILADRDDPAGGDQVVSVHDRDARRGKHGAYFTGYLLDVALDADSQIITALELLPANGDEAADATSLISHEERVHDTDVQTRSIDKAGFRGELLREWQNPLGLGLEVVVPPTKVNPTPYFTAADFTHDAEARALTCPDGVTTTRRTRNWVDTGWKYVFARNRCASCPLQARCVEKLPKTTGRMVVINDYAAEYAAARAKTSTTAYQQIRREHPAIERKLAEMVCRHDGRWARYRGRARNRIQYLLTGLVVNVKRMVHLLLGPAQVAREVCPIDTIAV